MTMIAGAGVVVGVSVGAGVAVGARVAVGSGWGCIFTTTGLASAKGTLNHWPSSL